MVRHRRSRRSPFVVTIASVATVVACGGSTGSDLSSGGSAGTGGGGTSGSSGSSGSSGTSGSGGTGAGCPSAFPTHGTSCNVPASTTCTYNQSQCCPSWEAKCVDGSWQAFASSCNPPPPDPCPEQIPTHGTACGSSEPCGNDYQYCSYGTCADGTTAATVAECNGGTWSVTQNCSPPSCEGLSACDCHERPDCQIVSDGCLCICDYSCEGMPPCDCSCGGGAYLGCKAI